MVVPRHFLARADLLLRDAEAGPRAIIRAPLYELCGKMGDHGQTYAVPPKRPHLVTNGGGTSAVFLVLQGIGEYDFVPLM